MADSIAIGAAYRDQAISAGKIDATPIGATSASTGAFTTLTASGATTLNGNVAIGDAAADTVGFYGATAVSQRASSVQATSALASSTDFGTYQLAVLVEVMNTLKGVGLWKGSA